MCGFDEPCGRGALAVVKSFFFFFKFTVCLVINCCVCGMCVWLAECVCVVVCVNIIPIIIIFMQKKLKPGS